MYSSGILVINLLSVLDYYGVHAQEKNAIEEEEDLTRYFKADNYKPALFGSHAYDPIKEEFLPLKHKKHEAEAHAADLSGGAADQAGSAEPSAGGSTTTKGSTAVDENKSKSTTHTQDKVVEHETEKDASYFLRHSMVQNNSTSVSYLRHRSRDPLHNTTRVLRPGFRNKNRNSESTPQSSTRFL